MLPRPRKSSLRDFLVYTVIAAIALPIVPSVRGAERDIDLDGNLANGAESRVVTRVLQTFPVEIENVIHNNANGESYTFKWPGAGPGGFGSYVTAGPDVGTKWEWSTISQVYSIESPVSFVPARGLAVVGAPPQGIQVVGGGSGVFVVPGKSTSPAQVTPSGTSLTSSLVTFFSPEQTIATCEGSFAPGRFERTITNNSGETVTFTVEQQDCCPEPHMTICDDGCQFYLTDPNNCGGCGVECAFDEFCDQGACEPICPAGQSLCGEECFDLLNDPSNCGDCGVECAWDELCDQGSCEPICPGQTLCGETCVDLQTDPNNCGDCDIQCAFDEFCDQASCEPICDPGLSLCGETCVDLQTDRNHCGSCDFACDPLYRCSGGLCEPDCPPGHVLCGVTCVNLLNDPGNCGACGLQCDTQYLCANGLCEPDCPPGQVVCDEMCVDLQSDPGNCGACGVTCGFDEFCDQGSCEPICPGQTLCGETCVDIQVDPMNCGGCGITCGSQDICEVGQCVPACPPGQTLCDGVCVDLTNDPDNCGACGAVCRGPDEICLLSCAIPPECTGICVVCEDPENCEPPTSGSTDQTAASFSIRDQGPRDRVSKRSRADRVSGLRDSLDADEPALHSRRRKVPRRDLEGTTATVETGEPAETTSRSVIEAVVEAPVCDLDPVEQVLGDGESLTLCQSGAIVGREVFTTATVLMNGQRVGQGPCAQIVPAPEVTIPEFLPSPTAVFVTDTSGDGLCQPGETCEMFISVQNLGTAAFLNPVATLSSPADGYNPLPLSFASDTSAYPNFPAFTEPGDCDTPAVLDPKTNFTEYAFTVPAEQDPDVGRVFLLSFQGDLGTDTVVEMPIVIGIGGACDPLTDIDGETYDRLLGFQSPVNADLVPEGNPVNFSNKRFNIGSTIPLKLQLGCGSVILGSSGIDPNPEIVALVHDTLGPQSLLGINGDNNANPDDPFFSCGSSSCDYQFRTEQLEPGDYVISIQMPDTRVFQAGFTLRP